MNRATEMAPGVRARCVPNRHGLFPPRNWQPSQCIALLALSGTCRYHARNEAGIRADTAHAWRRAVAFNALATTPVEINDVSEDLIRLTPDLCMETPRQCIPCRPGPQFGSRYPGDPHRLTLLDFLPDPQLEKVVNLEDFAGMLVFDKWTCNPNGRQTLFRRTQDEAQAPNKTIMIDQGFCFNAGEWNFPDAPLRSLYARNRL